MNHNVWEEDVYKRQPKYIPVGFEVIETISDKEIQYISFEKESKYFCISQRLNSENRTFCIDTEDSVIINIEFDGKNGFYSEKEGKQSIYLNTGRISINIYEMCIRDRGNTTLPISRSYHASALLALTRTTLEG